MYAPKTYLPLELIHCEQPFVKILRSPLKDAFCESCFEEKVGLKSCKQCLAVKYCSKRCQKDDWRDHKLECLKMKNLPKSLDQDLVRLLGKTILKVKGKAWKDIRVRILERVVTFDDINSNSAFLKENPLMKLYCKQMKILTGRFIGEENMPEEDDLIEIIGKIKYNTFMKTNDTHIVGSFIFIGASLFENECIPTASYTVVNNGLKIWAIKKIVKGTQKITLSFRKVLSKNSSLDDTLVKLCKCGECTLPYGKALLNKILNEEQAYSVILETETFLKITEIAQMMNECFFMVEDYVDELLSRQYGVLGRTNILHLRLLAFKCFNMERGLQAWFCFKELESDMIRAFGEYYLELERIYQKLASYSFLMGNLSEGLSYYSKIRKMTCHIFE